MYTVLVFGQALSTVSYPNVPDITFDISRIHTETEVFSQPQPNQPSQNGMVVAVSQRQKKSCSMAPINLSTIKEESSSSRSSTTSSSSSSTSSGCVSQESLSSAEVHVNPFSSEIVNMMLNSMSPSLVDKVMHHHLGQAPQLVSGRRVLLGHQEYTGLKKIASGGFGNIYTCSEKGDSKVLKVLLVAIHNYRLKLHDNVTALWYVLLGAKACNAMGDGCHCRVACQTK